MGSFLSAAAWERFAMLIRFFTKIFPKQLCNNLPASSTQSLLAARFPLAGDAEMCFKVSIPRRRRKLLTPNEEATKKS
jgi:hypothetical protein